MPAIRDKSWSFESTTTDAGITIPMCAYEQNDLLIVFAVGDTGTPTWTAPSGYTQLFARNNTTSNVCFFKIATSSESDPVVGSTVNETYNGCVISIRDIDTNTPFYTTSYASYLTSNQDSTAPLGNGTITGIGQSFTGTGGIIATAKFYLSKTGSPTGNITAKLYAHSGTFGTSSIPTGSALATSNTISAESLTGSLVFTEFKFPSAWATLTNATNYVITVEYSGGDGSNYVNVGYDGSSPSHGGNYSENTGIWAANSGRDVIFEVRRFDYNEASQTGASRVNMPTITTERDNTLLIYAISASVAAAPTFLEGPVHHLTGGDGAAESIGVGWGYKRTAGTTSSAVYANSYASGNGMRAVLGINPPSSGATIIPPYVVTDNCSLLDLLHGVTAYNGNTAFAATADTNFGTSFDGITANDATTAAIGDVGIYSFHSMAGATNATTTGQISGAELVFSVGNRPNIGTKNVLCHIRPATPLQSQRFTNISSNRGAWFGVRSGTAADYKIWRVHAIDAPWAPTVHVPVIINSGAGNTKASNGSLNTSSILALGFWHGGITGSNTCQIGWGMAWLMDNTIIAGGNSTQPLTIEDIVNTIAIGSRQICKERYSAILQGAKQLLLLQDLQIGDGGTNEVYLGLDSTAIEFPSQFNTSTKKINYNSTDNAIGITYYAGSSDTIIHRNSVISSPSRYKWGLHASSSTSATYDFSGLSVIGAGTISIARAIIISELTINDYTTIDASNINLDTCTILNPPTANDSLTTNGSTFIENSFINVTTITAGNRLCSITNPEIFENTSFTGSVNSGHSMRITSTGTYDFIGNTFTGFGPVKRSFDTQTGINGTTDVVTLDATHNYSTGNPIYYQKHGGSNAIGLTNSTLYYVRSIASNQLSFYPTQTDANNDTNKIDLTAAGSSETHWIYSAGSAIYNDSGGLITINVSGDGNTPSIRNSESSSTTVNNTVTITVTVLDKNNNPIQNASVYIQAATGPFNDNSHIIRELTNVSGIATESYAYISDTSVIIRVRKKGKINIDTAGTITVNGLSATVIMSDDLNIE
jgi:hypothetical protein